ncbi:TetR/AcrR family transcriptional regulator [Streptomyces albipurpureus]|uniref:TetR/AcrR family transcriptional regulator n=1 Tax=Streptomyces albipurpureus TaxID=2897419 RepID=A0ABT0V248_9ACTN|nr:TetR/AcrR family transcriptional regulator [Streptomyces sp. CWNU-1]MCM2393461.1 TetR/AcrR family transcriptional regulator [Streptomyces sp. CWNU-1]
MINGERRGTSGRSQARRAELIATGRKLFAHTSYDALSMDDIARSAGVAKGLIYYYFSSKRGYYLAIIEDSVADLVTRAAGHTELPRAQRVRRTVDGYLRYAQHNEAAFRTIVTGGVGFDTDVQSIREVVRAELVATIAEGAYGRREIPPLARLALLGWLSAVELIALEWIGDQVPDREAVGALLTRLLRATLATIEEFEPSCPQPPAEEPSAGGPVLQGFSAEV